MKVGGFSLLLAFSPLAAADCVTTAANVLKNYTWLLAPTDEQVAEICQDPSAVITDLKEVIEACNVADYEVVGSVMNLVENVLCIKEDELYCLPSLVNMVPIADLLTGDLTKINFYKELNKSSKLDKICRTDRCTKKIAHMAIKSLQGTEAGNSIIPMVRDVARAAQSACVKDKAGTRCNTLDLFSDDGSVNTAVACSENKMTPCFRKIASTRELNATDPCRPSTDPEEEKEPIANVVMELAGLAYSLFQEHRETIMAYLKEDLGFNVPGVLPEDLDLSFEEKGDSVTVSITLKGMELYEIDVIEAIEMFKEYLTNSKDLVSFPLVDTWAMNMQTTEALVSETASITTEIVVSPTPEAPAEAPTEEAASSASVAYLASSAVAVVLAAVLVM